ncbi:MAG: TspO/MBR family protein [Pseudomonadota bacterium]
MKKYITPALWILAFQIIGGGIGFITNSDMSWYDGLEKSALTPPGFVFGIVWPILYVMLALAGWMMWCDRKAEGAQTPHNLFWMQMFLNWGWSFVFFQFQLIEIGLFWILALIIAMVAFVTQAWANFRMAALLVVPTVLWACFAAYLNYAIWVLN